MQEMGVVREGEGAWTHMPGLESPDLIFDPTVLQSLADLQPELHGAIDNAMDRATANVRTLLFSTDFSAWTVQGLMAAATNPIGFIMAAPQLAAASVFGDRYTASWLRANPDIVRRFTAAASTNWSRAWTCGGSQSSSRPRTGASRTSCRWLASSFGSTTLIARRSCRRLAGRGRASLVAHSRTPPC